MLSSEQIFGCWARIKDQLKNEFGDVTENELRKVEGNIEQLIGLIQYKSGQARVQIEARLAEMSLDPNSVADAGREYAQQAAEAAQQFAGDIQERLGEQLDQVRETVRQRPAESVAIAFGTGIVAGIILGLLSRSK